MGLLLSRVHSIGVSAADILLPLNFEGTTTLHLEPVPPASLPTYISPGIKVKGTITADEDLYIDGDVKGTLSAPGHRITIGEMAYLNAETVARELVIYGAVQGGLCGFERIEIKKRASVAGDLVTAQIVIEDGAHFKGVIAAGST